MKEFSQDVDPPMIKVHCFSKNFSSLF